MVSLGGVVPQPFPVPDEELSNSSYQEHDEETYSEEPSASLTARTHFLPHTGSNCELGDPDSGEGRVSLQRSGVLIFAAER